MLKNVHGVYGGLIKAGIGTEYDCVPMMVMYVSILEWKVAS